MDRKTVTVYEKRNLASFADGDVTNFSSGSSGAQWQETYERRRDVWRLCEIERIIAVWAIRCNCRHRCRGCNPTAKCPHTWPLILPSTVEGERIVKVVE
jgi:hypothetical protein